MPLQTAEKVLALYQEKYFDLNAPHFQEKLLEEEQIEQSYKWIYRALLGRDWCRSDGSRRRTSAGEGVVAKDNTVAVENRHWQIEKTRFRHTLAGGTVTIHEHLDGTVSIRYGTTCGGTLYPSQGKRWPGEPAPWKRRERSKTGKTESRFPRLAHPTVPPRR